MSKLYTENDVKCDMQTIKFLGYERGERKRRCWKNPEDGTRKSQQKIILAHINHNSFSCQMNPWDPHVCVFHFVCLIIQY